MNPEAFAVIAYGIMANVAALVLGAAMHSPAGMALVFVSAGLTYLFQLGQLLMGDSPFVGPLLMVLAIVTLIASVAVSLGVF